MMTRSGVGTMVTLLTLLVTRSNAQDTVRVRADGPPAWGPEVRLVQDVAIGELDGPQEYAFGRIDKGAMEPSGGFYLFDANDGQIRRYDRSGRFVNLVGRKGGGPGEYGSVAMAVTRDGLLVVWDGRNSRVTYFRPDGKVMDDFPMTRPGFYGSNFVIDTAGFIYQTVGTGGPLAEGAGSRQQYLRFTPAGALHDSILLPDRYMPPGSPRRFSLSTSDGMRWNFVEQRIVAPYAGGGVISGTSHRYRYAVTVPGSRCWWWSAPSRRCRSEMRSARIGSAPRTHSRAALTGLTFSTKSPAPSHRSVRSRATTWVGSGWRCR